LRRCPPFFIGNTSAGKRPGLIYNIRVKCEFASKILKKGSFMTSPEKWPKTLSEAVKICLLTLTPEEKTALKNTSEESLIYFKTFKTFNKPSVKPYRIEPTVAHISHFSITTESPVNAFAAISKADARSFKQLPADLFMPYHCDILTSSGDIKTSMVFHLHIQTWLDCLKTFYGQLV
jgi:hypothetical protein